MVLFQQLALVTLVLSVVAEVEISVFPSNAEIVQSQDLVVRVDIKGASFKSCRFENGYGDFNVSEDSTNDVNLEYEENSDKTFCKLIVRSIESKYKGTWSANIDFNEDELEAKSATFTIGMIEPTPVETNRTISASVGSKLHETCATLQSQAYAKIFNPYGILVAEGRTATLDIPFVRMSDEGIWRCDVQMNDRTNQIQIFLKLVVTNSTEMETSVTETEDSFQLLCKTSSIFGTCVFESPQGVLFAPTPGFLDGRYSYFGTGKNECGISIEKPLNENEIGPWRCLMTLTEQAAFLYVGGSTSKTSTRTPNTTLVLGDDLTIHCSMQQPLTYCFLRSPMGRIFSSISADSQGWVNYTGLGLEMGDCQINVAGSHIWKNESGNWHCGMGGASLEDSQIQVEVEIEDSPFEASASVLEVNTGGSVSIICRSVMSYGLRYCRFIHPSGRSFNLSPKIQSHERYIYSGHGLESGACGILINDISTDDLGEWSCAATFVGDQWTTEYKQKVILSSYTWFDFNGTIISSVICGAVAAVALGSLVYWNHKRQARRQSIFHVDSMRYFNHRRSIGSDSSSEINTSSLHLS